MGYLYNNANTLNGWSSSACIGYVDGSGSVYSDKNVFSGYASGACIGHVDSTAHFVYNGPNTLNGWASGNCVGEFDENGYIYNNKPSVAYGYASSYCIGNYSNGYVYCNRNWLTGFASASCVGKAENVADAAAMLLLLLPALQQNIRSGSASSRTSQGSTSGGGASGGGASGSGSQSFESTQSTSSNERKERPRRHSSASGSFWDTELGFAIIMFACIFAYMIIKNVIVGTVSAVGFYMGIPGTWALLYYLASMLYLKVKYKNRLNVKSKVGLTNSDSGKAVGQTFIIMIIVGIGVGFIMGQAGGSGSSLKTRMYIVANIATFLFAMLPIITRTKYLDSLGFKSENAWDCLFGLYKFFKAQKGGSTGYSRPNSKPNTNSNSGPAGNKQAPNFDFNQLFGSKFKQSGDSKAGGSNSSKSSGSNNGNEEYFYVKCPNAHCGATIRLPIAKKNSRMVVTCPRCGLQFNWPLD